MDATARKQIELEQKEIIRLNKIINETLGNPDSGLKILMENFRPSKLLSQN